MARRPRRMSDAELARSVMQEGMLEEARRFQNPDALVGEVLRTIRSGRDHLAQIDFAEDMHRRYRAATFLPDDPRAQSSIEMAAAWCSLATMLRVDHLLTSTRSMLSEGFQRAALNEISRLMMQAADHFQVVRVGLVSETMQATPPVPC
jgi:hypothetical protein